MGDTFRQPTLPSKLNLVSLVVDVIMFVVILWHTNVCAVQCAA